MVAGEELAVELTRHALPLGGGLDSEQPALRVEDGPVVGRWGLPANEGLALREAAELRRSSTLQSQGALVVHRPVVVVPVGER